MKIDRELTLGFLTPTALDSKVDGLRLLEILSNQGKQFCPEFYGNSEPVRLTFSKEDLQNALDAWSYPFLWKRRKGVVCEGSVWMANRGCHGAIYLSARVKGVHWPEVLDFVRACVDTFNCDFGYVHLTCEAEISDPRVPREALYPVRIGVTTHDLRKGIPHLCWMTVLGKPFVELIGQERLCSTPVGMVESYSEGAVSIRLSRSPEDIGVSYNEIAEARESVIDYLGRELFWNDKPEAGTAVVPKFRNER